MDFFGSWAAARLTAAARLAAATLLAGVLAGCATRIEPAAPGTAPRLRMQNGGLAPGSGGALVQADSLLPGDILLSSGSGIASSGIQLFTVAPVSHAAIYLGNGQIVEAVGKGVRLRSLQDALDDESVVAAFRHPQTTAESAALVGAFVLSKVGAPYNHLGVLLHAPFAVQRRICELPLVPGPVREFCVRGVATVQMGFSSNDRFFCSQLVLEAYRQAGISITSADPRWVSPADLLHMREGDVPSIAPKQPLQYVGHLKYTAPPAQAAQAALDAS